MTLSNKSRLIGYAFMGRGGEYLKKITIEVSGKSGTRIDFKFTEKLSEKVICYDTLEDIRDAVRFLSSCRTTTELFIIELYQDGKKLVSKVWQ